MRNEIAKFISDTYDEHLECNESCFHKSMELMERYRVADDICNYLKANAPTVQDIMIQVRHFEAGTMDGAQLKQWFREHMVVKE